MQIEGSENKDSKCICAAVLYNIGGKMTLYVLMSFVYTVNVIFNYNFSLNFFFFAQM